MRAPEKLYAQKMETSNSIVASKKKKAHLKSIDADSRPFIDHLVINVGFFQDHALERVVDLQENQG